MVALLYITQPETRSGGGVPELDELDGVMRGRGTLVGAGVAL